MKLKLRKSLRLFAATIISGVFAAVCGGFITLPHAEWITHSQFAPSVMRFLEGAALSGAVTAGIILLFSIFAGRWYCALLCPMGTAIDLIDLIPFFRKKAVRNDLATLRLFVFVIAVTLAVLGVNWGFMILDPYANFGEITVSITRKSFHAGTIVMGVILLFLALWKRRFFCTSICPVGTFLNLASTRSIIRLSFTDKCVNCKMCEKNCPAGCIDVAAKKVDNGRCVRCLECLDVCKFKGLSFSTAGVEQKAPESDNSRREFIKKSSTVLGGAVAGGILLKAGLDEFAAAEPFSMIAPPGAGSMEEFRKRCISCLICVQNCPQQIITPGENGDGPVSLDLNGKFCKWDCHMCTQVCPTGALKDMTLKEKQHTRIAFPKVSEKCVTCGLCVAACPAKAIRFNDEDMAAPDPQRCIGCGKCAVECPHHAIVMMPILKQKTLDKSN